MAAVVASSLQAHTSSPGEYTELPTYTIRGRANPLLGTASTAAQGEVGATDIAARPFLRRGELLEVIPGLAVTQHSGGGKANQYFLRGFNLDHGTDFAISVDGVPVNMRTHAHGQGYADINFIVPEFVDVLAHTKGPFLAAVGDFSAAGAADLRLVTELAANFITVSVGQDDHRRAVAGLSAGAGDHGALTVGAEVSTYDGPWDLPEDFRRVNSLLRYHSETQERTYTATLLAYDASWDSTDQIPRRLVESGSLSRLGNIDPTDGGESNRFGATLAGTWRHADAETRASLYATRYRLDLFSNFTYLLDDPVEGDQFEQFDDRWILGGSLERTWNDSRSPRKTRRTVGLQWRSDLIDEVSLHRSRARVRGATVRSDEVRQHSLALFLQHETQWSEHWRTVAGMRGDFHTFDVTSDLAANSGDVDDFIASPKLALIYTPGNRTELYLSAGTGYHSNDARGTTIAIDPATGDPTEPVDPLVRSFSIEAGVRAASVRGLVTTLSFFYIGLDSELLFVGDAGNTEASGTTRRYGLEFASFYRPLRWLTLDLDATLAHARFADAPGARRIPGAVSSTVSAGITAGGREGLFGTLRARYLGPRKLTEDAAVEGSSSLLFNARVGWRARDWEIALDVLNLLDRKANDIEYYYTSRVAGEPLTGVSDIHFHPVEPRTWRVSASRRF